nr:LysR family transcriptional regulator substrate-binding protein [Aeromonas salmonicida]
MVLVKPVIHGLGINPESERATVDQRPVVLRPIGDGVKRFTHDADLRGMVVLRSLGFQLVPFKLHRFRKQRRSYYFPPILMAFKHRYPGLKIRVEEAGSRELLSRMVDGTLDLAILITSDLPPALEGAQLLREEMLMVVGEEHPLRYAQAVSLTQFFDQELAMFRRGFITVNTWKHWLRSWGVSLTLRLKAI